MIVYFGIGFIATTIGACSGIGGGVIIKPLLDAIGNIPLLERNFLSSATVLAMAVVTLLRSSKDQKSELRLKIALPLAFGSVLGGIIGSRLIVVLKASLHNEALVTTIQSVILLAVLFAIFCNINHQSRQEPKCNSIAQSSLLGLILGAVSVMLGIGGGPLNVAVLTFFYGMSSKECVANSLLIILFSQASGLITSILSNGWPLGYVKPLSVMIFGGILGGLVGHRLISKLSGSQIQFIFKSSLIGICSITAFNIIRTLFCGG